MMKTTRRSRGFTLIASMLMMLLLSGIAIGLMMMVNTEGKVGSADLQNNSAYHSAEGGIEQMTSDLAAMFKTVQAPNPSDICALSSHQPYISGVTWKDYQVQPASGCAAALQNNYGQITSGPNQGLWAQIIPVSMLATAAQAGGQEVSMMRTAQVALIPVFQFGVFCDGDCSFFSGPNFDFAGRVHTNGDLYPEVGPGSTLVFHDKVSAYGNIVRNQLANGYPTATNYNGTVLVPTAAQGCDGARPACRALALTEGSVLGAGGNPPQSSQNSGWPSVSLSSYNSKIVDGNYGNSGGTGAKNLSLPFVNGTAFPYQIIRRPPPGEDPASALGASREYNLAQIRVLLSDDPAEMNGGAGDPDNVRLANVAGSNQYGIATSTPAGLPALAAGSTYNTYFATASNGYPDETPCNGAACTPVNTVVGLLPDLPLAPTAAPVGAQTLVPVGAPNLLAGAAPAPGITLCPPPNVAAATLPAGCSNVAATSPYYAVANPANAATWNMIDGWLRVEYKDATGVWHGVTREWLGYGFARGTLPPTAPVGTAPAPPLLPNPVNPAAILILQQPADRNGNGAIDSVGIPPACTKVVSSVCTQWTNALPPEVITDPTSTSPYFGVTSAGTAVQSVSQNNWYPINFYDTREGEIRDVAAGNNSCPAAGVMNAVEIDVGNLKKWLWGSVPYGAGSGTSVDFTTQNGWVLYFSDRRGMLPNPTALNTKTGDSGFEDSINSASAPGVTDGVLDPIPPGKNRSPEDVNQNGVLDNYGAQNLGLGFYNTAAPSLGNINTQIVAAAPDNPYVPRLNSCQGTARKNWVSGARHAVKLVDGSFGNVPYRLDGTLASPGGFSLASENPVYVLGDFNSNVATFGAADSAGHAAAAVIADSVTLLSNAWTDLNSTAFPTTLGSRNATTTYYRLAIAGGKNINFPKPAAFGSNDYGTDGGVHNFLRYLENWGGQTLNYKGSMVSLYYSTYATGVFKCCTTVYSPPTRAYSFDADFALPGGLPPGTPLFRDVDTLGYRQLFAIRDK